VVGGRLEATDDQLMVQVKAGSSAAFGELYDRFGHRAYRVARSVCRDNHHAEDAVQDAFISIWKSRTTYEPARGTLAAWLLTTVRYSAIDVARRNGRHANRRAGVDHLDAVPTPLDVAEEASARAGARHLHSLLARLPEAQREVITLAMFGQLTHNEISDHLGLPAGTVKSRVRLGLDKLRAELEASGSSIPS